MAKKVIKIEDKRVIAGEDLLTGAVGVKYVRGEGWLVKSNSAFLNWANDNGIKVDGIDKPSSNGSSKLKIDPSLVEQIVEAKAKAEAAANTLGMLVDKALNEAGEERGSLEVDGGQVTIYTFTYIPAENAAELVKMGAPHRMVPKLETEKVKALAKTKKPQWAEYIVEKAAVKVTLK